MLKAKTINIIFNSLIVVSILLCFLLKWSFWIPVSLAFIWLCITIIGSFNIQLNYHLDSLCRQPSISTNQVALTFDDGPHPDFTPKVLELLKKHQAKATFFCVGRNLETYPELAKTTLEQGHTIGNHTYSHSPAFGFFSTKKVVIELQRTNGLITQLVKKSPLLYRPIYGVTNPAIKRAVKQLNLKSIGWNVRSLDTVLNENQAYNRLLKIKKGDLILLHDTSQKTVNILERLLQSLSEQNLSSVTVDELLNIEAYE